MLLFKQVLILRARFDDICHVDVIIGGEQRRVILCFLQAFGDRLAQARHLDALLTTARASSRRLDSWRRGRCRRRRLGRARSHGGHHIILRQAAVLAGALDLARVESMLQHQAANGWRQSQIPTLILIGRRRSRRSRRRSLCLGNRSGSRGSHRRSGGNAFVDHRQQRADVHRVAFLGDDVAQGSRDRCGHIHRHLVGFQADDRFIGLHRLAGLLQPLTNGRFGNGFAQRGDFDFSCHELCQPFFWRRISSRTL